MRAILFAALLTGVLMSRIEAEEIPPAGKESGDLRQLAEAAIRSEKAAEQSRQQARSAAALYLQAAEAQCRLLLAGDPDYSNAVARADVVKHEIAGARAKGDSAAVVEASSKLSRLEALVSQSEEREMSTDPDVVGAK